MNVKLVLIGGLAFYVATWLLSMVTGPVIHEGVLAESYKATATFWRPELLQVPPNLVALLPRWIPTGLALSFIVAALYGKVRPAIGGHGLARGARYGFGVGLLSAGIAASWSGVFNLPDIIWFWWSIEGLAMYVIGGAVLGWVADRWCTAPAG
jgi:hypothetical protein